MSEPAQESADRHDRNLHVRNNQVEQSSDRPQQTEKRTRGCMNNKPTEKNMKADTEEWEEETKRRQVEILMENCDEFAALLFGKTKVFVNYDAQSDTYVAVVSVIINEETMALSPDVLSSNSEPSRLAALKSLHEEMEERYSSFQAEDRKGLEPRRKGDSKSPSWVRKRASEEKTPREKTPKVRAPKKRMPEESSPSSSSLSNSSSSTPKKEIIRVPLLTLAVKAMFEDKKGKGWGGDSRSKGRRK